MTREINSAHWQQVWTLIGYLSSAWRKSWHRAMHKQMESTTHFVYWWCRTCHRRWATRKSG
jgi:hypothetical protein